MRHWAATCTACLFVLSPSVVAAQFSPGARSVAMGGAGMVYSSGVDAIEWNPANLALESGWNVSGEFGMSGLMSGVSCDDIGAILGFGQCDSQPWGWNFDDVGCDATVTAGIPDNGVTVSTNSEGFLTAFGADKAGLPKPGSPLPTIGITVGSVGVRARSRVMTETTVSKELMGLMCEGFDPAMIQQYQVGNTGFRTTSFSEVTAGYGTTLGGRLGVGVGVRYVMGHSLTQGRFFEPVLDLTNETIEVTGIAVESTGGSGFGLDVGLALDLIAGLRVSVSGTNIIQKMNWDESLVAHEATYTGCSTGSPSCPNGDDFDQLDFEDFINRFEGEPIAGGSVSLPVYQTAQELFRAAYFPTVFRAGAGWRAGGTTVELVGASVSPRGRQKNEWDERISLGVEQWLWILALRAGGALGSDGLQAINGGIALALGPVHLDVSGGFMSGGFDFASGVVTPQNVEYAGAQLTVALQLKGGGR
ncbi:MAG: DUF5723 family protein [Gemmatimonadota bacterium]|nr:DUF5723 family protein [Gemmatimonadota bacterium]